MIKHLVIDFPRLIAGVRPIKPLHKMKTLLVLSIVALSTVSVWAAPQKSVEIPAVGDVFGPMVIEFMDGLLWRVNDHYLWRITPDDVLVDVISADKVFDDKEEMYKYALNHPIINSVAVRIDSNELEGKYVEILSMKRLSGDDVHMVCHDYPGAQNFCHDDNNSGHESKYAYAVVKRMDDNTIFPVVFFSHKVCNKVTCYWVTHLSPIAVISKSAIN